MADEPHLALRARTGRGGPGFAAYCGGNTIRVIVAPAVPRFILARFRWWLSAPWRRLRTYGRVSDIPALAQLVVTAGSVLTVRES